MVRLPFEAVTFLVMVKFTWIFFVSFSLGFFIALSFLSSKIIWMFVASSCAAMATFSESEAFSLLRPAICVLRLSSSAFTREFSCFRLSFRRFSESTWMIYDRNTARTVASSFFRRVISRASSALTFFNSSSNFCVFICSCVSCSTIESLLICVFISEYCRAKRSYSFSISCLSSSANSCMSRFTCLCSCRFIKR